MSENKTTLNEEDPAAFLAMVEHTVRRENAIEVIALMRKVSGEEPKMWGASMIGFGQYHYQYATGREGDCYIIGLSPRKANLTLYIMPGYQNLSAFLDRLGKHKTGKCCLYINKLADIDMAVLEELLIHAWNDMKSRYPN